MLAHHLDVGLERVNEPLDAGIEVVAGAEHDPAETLQRLGNVRPRGRLAETYGQHALIDVQGVVELLPARRRGERRLAQQEHERVASVDRLDHRHAPVLAGLDTCSELDVPVYPDLASATDERFTQPADDLGVLGRVGEKDVSHGASSAAAIRGRRPGRRLSGVSPPGDPTAGWGYPRIAGELTMLGVSDPATA